VIHPETIRRLLSTSRVQAVVEDRSGDAVKLGRITRLPSASMVRQIRHRDRGVDSPAAARRLSPRPITSSGGATGVQPIWTTCS
jgi:hypothetical protein